MALACAAAIGLLGLQGHLVEIEADIGDGLPTFTMVGLPDASVREARDRMRAAVVNSQLRWPQRRMTVNLTPATLPKHGSAFDLALAIAVLAANGDLPPPARDGPVFLGELGLDGAVRPVLGVLPAVLAAQAAGRDRVIVPAGNLAEAALVPAMSVSGVTRLADLVAHLRGEPDRLVTASAVVEPGGRWKSPPRAGTTCTCTGRREQARRCSLSGCQGSCPCCPTRRRWR